MKDYNCSDCYYCEVTNNFMTRWCSYWNKMVFLTGGCCRDTTVFDYDYDDCLNDVLDGDGDLWDDDDF